VGAIATLLALLVFTPLGSACVSQGVAPQNPPDKGQFLDGGVNLFMMARCGALDCHGQMGRPLRLYSPNGLRKVKAGDPFADRPVGPLTQEELDDNYASVVGLEPEAIGYARSVNGNYDDYLLLRKPVDDVGGGVRHKGGPVLRTQADPGFACLRSWIAGEVSTPDCTLGAQL